MEHHQRSAVVSTVINSIKKDEIKINKDYQRNYVWNNTDIQSELIGSMLINAPIGTIILHEKNIDNIDKETEIIDGQQRLLTIEKYINNEFQLNKTVCININKTREDGPFSPEDPQALWGVYWTGGVGGGWPTS